MRTFRKTLGFIVFIISIAIAIYVGAWVMFIHPILDCCKAIDTGTLTGMMVGTTIIKCIFSSGVASLIVTVGNFANYFISGE